MRHACEISVLHGVIGMLHRHVVLEGVAWKIRNARRIEGIKIQIFKNVCSASNIYG